MKILFFVFFPTLIFCQNGDIPEVAFLIHGEIVPISSKRFEKLLVSDSLLIDSNSQVMFNSRFNSSASFKFLVERINPTLKDSLHYNTEKILIPSYDKSVTYLKQQIGSVDSNFDLVIYPSLREKLKMQSLNKKYSNPDFQKFIDYVDTVIANNIPIDKSSLESLILLGNRIYQEQERQIYFDQHALYSSGDKKDLDDLVNEVMFLNEPKTISVSIQTLDSLENPVKHLEIYYCPVWASFAKRKVSSFTTPVKMKLPVADYYFWAGGESMENCECQCNCSNGIQIRNNGEPVVVTLKCIKR